MEKKIDYSRLYELQDAALDIVFSLKHGFYLTGGTALHRFYYANKKSPVDRLALTQRLRTFPLEWLSNIKETRHIEITADTIERICADIAPK